MLVTFPWMRNFFLYHQWDELWLGTWIFWDQVVFIVVWWGWNIPFGACSTRWNNCFDPDIGAIWSPNRWLCGAKSNTLWRTCRVTITYILWNQETSFFSWQRWFSIFQHFLSGSSLFVEISDIFCLAFMYYGQLISCHQPQREGKWRETWKRLWSWIL